MSSSTLPKTFSYRTRRPRVQCDAFRSQRQHGRFAGAFCIHRERGNGFTDLEFDRTVIAILLDHSADEFVVLADELGDEELSGRSYRSAGGASCCITLSLNTAIRFDMVSASD